MSSLAEKLKSLRDRRVEAEMEISVSQTQLGSLSAKLNILTGRKGSLEEDLAELRWEKEAILNAVR